VDVELATLEKFLNYLKILDEKRQGSAILESGELSEDHFRLECFSLDKLGHIGLTVELLKGHFTGSRYYPLEITLSFEIDPSNLPYLVKAFTELVNSLKKNAS
jgi:hypothetical protein